LTSPALDTALPKPSPTWKPDDDLIGAGIEVAGAAEKDGQVSHLVEVGAGSDVAGDEVREAVAVEVTGGQAGAEAGRGHRARHRDRGEDDGGDLGVAGIDMEAPLLLEMQRGAAHDLGKAVAVEVAQGQGLAELLVALERADLAVGLGIEDRARLAGVCVDHAAQDRALPIRGRTDQEVVDAVAVQVGEQAAEIEVPGTGRRRAARADAGGHAPVVAGAHRRHEAHGQGRVQVMRALVGLHARHAGR
jgi:hypothetical protein